MPIESSTGRFLRLPTTFPTLDSLYWHGKRFSEQRIQPLLLPSHRTCNTLVSNSVTLHAGRWTNLGREALIASVAKFDGLGSAGRS